jgi:separase
MILRVYAAGLHLINCDVKFRGSDHTSFGGAKYESAIRILCDDGNILHNLAAQLGSLGCCFHIGCKENCVITRVKYTDSVGQICSQMSSGYEACMVCTEKNRKAYLLFYLNALGFLCQPLAELVNSERKQLVSENEDAFVTTRLCVIQDIFHQFTDIFLSCQR